LTLNALKGPAKAGTGFDAKFLNTLYVGKNLKHRGLIQAFSRANRVLNAPKAGSSS
jgi:type I site-specific restriction-modification system R (restriction) subunit